MLTEECDDGNTNNNDGCSSTCEIEDGYFCKIDSDRKSVCYLSGHYYWELKT